MFRKLYLFPSSGEGKETPINSRRSSKFFQRASKILLRDRIHFHGYKKGPVIRVSDVLQSRSLPSKRKHRFLQDYKTTHPIDTTVRISNPTYTCLFPSRINWTLHLKSIRVFKQEIDLSGLLESWAFSIVRYSQEQNDSETGSVSILRWGRERDTSSVGSVRKG
jgi:hypothetical protein